MWNSRLVCMNTHQDLLKNPYKCRVTQKQESWGVFWLVTNCLEANYGMYLCILLWKEMKMAYYDNLKNRELLNYSKYTSTSTVKPNSNCPEIILCSWWDQLHSMLWNTIKGFTQGCKQQTVVELIFLRTVLGQVDILSHP